MDVHLYSNYPVNKLINYARIKFVYARRVCRLHKTYWIYIFQICSPKVFFLMRVKLNLTAIGYMYLIGKFNCIYCVLSVQHEYQWLVKLLHVKCMSLWRNLVNRIFYFFTKFKHLPRKINLFLIQYNTNYNKLFKLK